MDILGAGRRAALYRLRPRPQLEAGPGTCRSAVVLAFYKWCILGSWDPGEQTHHGLLDVGCGFGMAQHGDSVPSVASKLPHLEQFTLPPSMDLCLSVCSGVIIKPLSSKD